MNTEDNYQYLPLKPAVNILQQPKSIITTNPNIKSLDDQSLPQKNPTFSDINKNLSTSVMGFFDDLFHKPNDIPWNEYFTMIIIKDQRYNYLGILLIFISFYIILLH